MSELQRLFRSHSPGRSLRHGGRVIVGGPASRVGCFAGHHQVSGDLRLGKLAKRNRLRATQVGVVRWDLQQLLRG